PVEQFLDTPRVVVVPQAAPAKAPAEGGEKPGGQPKGPAPTAAMGLESPGTVQNPNASKPAAPAEGAPAENPGGTPPEPVGPQTYLTLKNKSLKAMMDYFELGREAPIFCAAMETKSAKVILDQVLTDSRLDALRPLSPMLANYKVVGLALQALE